MKRMGCWFRKVTAWRLPRPCAACTPRHLCRTTWDRLVMKEYSGNSPRPSSSNGSCGFYSTQKAGLKGIRIHEALGLRETPDVGQIVRDGWNGGDAILSAQSCFDVSPAGQGRFPRHANQVRVGSEVRLAPPPSAMRQLRYHNQPLRRATRRHMLLR